MYDVPVSLIHPTKHIVASEKIKRKMNMMVKSMEKFLSAQQLNRLGLFGFGKRQMRRAAYRLTRGKEKTTRESLFTIFYNRRIRRDQMK